MPAPALDFRPVHVAWSPLAADLAVLDARGRLLLFSIGYGLGAMQPAGSSELDSLDATATVVGMRWLPVLPVQKMVSWDQF